MPTQNTTIMHDPKSMETTTIHEPFPPLPSSFSLPFFLSYVSTCVYLCVCVSQSILLFFFLEYNHYIFF